MRETLGSHGHVSAPHIKPPSAKCIPNQDFQDYTITWSVDDVEEKRLSFGVWQNNSHWCALDPYAPLKNRRKPGLLVKRKKNILLRKDVKNDQRKIRKMERSKQPSRPPCYPQGGSNSLRLLQYPAQLLLPHWLRLVSYHCVIHASFWMRKYNTQHQRPKRHVFPYFHPSAATKLYLKA